MFMYSMVDFMALWPRSCWTCITSLVLWYSMVPFQWRSEWKVIRFSLGLWSFLASLARIFRLAQAQHALVCFSQVPKLFQGAFVGYYLLSSQGYSHWLSLGMVEFNNGARVLGQITSENVSVGMKLRLALELLRIVNRKKDLRV